MNGALKLSAPAADGFWEIPVLFEDEHLLALDKPAGLLTSPARDDPSRPSLLELLHAGIAAGRPWARERGLGYLMNAHRLDFEASGVMLLAKDKATLIALANWFSSEKPWVRCVALVQGTPAENCFEVDVKVAPHPLKPGVMRVDPKGGKKSKTRFEVMERFSAYTLLRCESWTSRPHQLRVHLGHVGLPLAGDALYGGRPLRLSSLKPGYRLKAGKTERPLISRAALHAEQLTLPHPVTKENLAISAPWPRDLRVAVKYLRQFASAA